MSIDEFAEKLIKSPIYIINLGNFKNPTRIAAITYHTISPMHNRAPLLIDFCFSF